MIADRFKIGKSCADDEIVMEMLWSCSGQIWDVLAEAFKLRLLNHVSEDAEACWYNFVVHCLRKKVVPSHP